VEDGSFLLTNSLTYKNESDRSAPVQGFFHNYFALSSARDIAIVGPEDRTYIDLSDNDTEKLETSSPDKMIDGERFVGRVFQGMSMARIVDPTLGRVITIRGGLPSQPAREGEYDAVVWNPGRWEVADLDPKTWKYPFLHPDASMGMMCLEMGRLGSAVLQPGEEVTISQHVKVQFFGGI
jgi:D-hexose-6-phosphate mutarotase